MSTKKKATRKWDNKTGTWKPTKTVSRTSSRTVKVAIPIQPEVSLKDILCKLDMFQESIRDLKTQTQGYESAISSLSESNVRLSSNHDSLMVQLLKVPDTTDHTSLTQWYVDLMEVMNRINPERFGPVSELYSEFDDWKRRVETGSSMTPESKQALSDHITTLNGMN